MSNNLFNKFKLLFSEMKKSSKEKKLINSIGSGLKNKEFKMYLQLIVDTGNNKFAMAEARSNSRKESN